MQRQYKNSRVNRRERNRAWSIEANTGTLVTDLAPKSWNKQMVKHVEGVDAMYSGATGKFYYTPKFRVGYVSGLRYVNVEKLTNYIRDKFDRGGRECSSIGHGAVYVALREKYWTKVVEFLNTLDDKYQITDHN